MAKYATFQTHYIVKQIGNGTSYNTKILLEDTSLSVIQLPINRNLTDCITKRYNELADMVQGQLGNDRVLQITHDTKLLWSDAHEAD